MTRRPSTGVTKSQQQTIFHNDETNINGVKIYLNNELPSIMTRLPCIGVIKFQQQTTFHNVKTTIYWSNKISKMNYRP